MGPLCDCLTTADVLVLRTTGSKWYDAKLCGEFEELWIFLMTKKGGDGPHLCQNGPVCVLIIVGISALGCSTRMATPFKDSGERA